MKNRNIITMSLFLPLAILIATPNLDFKSVDDSPKSDPRVEFTDLTSFADLGEAFNQDRGSVRLVALLSASCGYCIKGYRYMRKLLDEIPDERLKMYVVWEPMLSGDTRKLSEKMARKAEDPRMVYQAWDEARITGEAWTRVMLDGDDRWSATGPAWDVYYLYGADVEWTEDAPSVPDYWQHQGAGSSELVLNYNVLKAEIESFLAQAD